MNKRKEDLSVGGIEREEGDRFDWEGKSVRYNGRRGKLKFVGSNKGLVYLAYENAYKKGWAVGLMLGDAEDFSRDYQIVDGELISKDLRRVLK